MEHLAPIETDSQEELLCVSQGMKKKRTLAVLGAVAVLALAAAAIAYWTTTGSGEGSGSVASSNGTVVLHGTISDELAPGGSSAVTFTADNAGSSSLQVGTVHAVVSIDEAHAKAGCKASDFTIADTVENQVIAAHATGAALANDGSISMADTRRKPGRLPGRDDLAGSVQLVRKQPGGGPSRPSPHFFPLTELQPGAARR